MKLRNILKSVFLIALLFIIAGCKEPNIADIKLSDYEFKQDIDDFNINDLSLVVTYDYKTMDIVKITEDMLSKEDLDKLKTIGTHEINIKYLDKDVILFIDLTDNYNVTYMIDREIVETQVVEHGKDATLPSEVVKDGYIFIGWNHDGKNITKDTVIEAIYELEKYEVKFMLDGEVIETQIIEHRKDADLSNIYREGYIILGWNHDGKSITENTIIEGTCELKKYTVKFYYDGELIDTQIIEHGNYATEPELSLEQLDYFEGWRSILYSPIKKDTDIDASVDFINGGKLLRYKNKSKILIAEFLKVSKEILTKEEVNLIESYINDGYDKIDNCRTNEEVNKITIYTKQLIENVVSKYYEDTFERIPGEEVYTEGDGTYKNPYIIDTKGKLIYLTNNTNNGIGRIAYYELREDIDLSDIEWIPIKSFNGHFNGNGYEISNYKINKSYKDKQDLITYIGLFGYNEGIIENLGVKNYDIEFKWECEYKDGGIIYIGGIVGENWGQINNCYFIGNIKLDYFNRKYNGEGIGYGFLIGGISGLCDSGNSNINNCYTQVHMDVKYINKNYITSCINEANYLSLAGITNGEYGRKENNLAIFTYMKDIYRCRFSDKETCYMGINNYYYTEDEKGLRGETTSEDLNSLEFYINTLDWNQEIWDLSNVVFKDGKFFDGCYPKIKK